MEPKHIIHGIAGLAKVGAQLAGVNVDQAPSAVIAQRRQACGGCPHATKHPVRGLTIHSICARCGCVINAKVRLASEKCPDLPPRWQKFVDGISGQALNPPTSVPDRTT